DHQQLHQREASFIPGPPGQQVTQPLDQRHLLPEPATHHPTTTNIGRTSRHRPQHPAAAARPSRPPAPPTSSASCLPPYHHPRKTELVLTAKDSTRKQRRCHRRCQEQARENRTVYEIPIIAVGIERD